MARLHWSPIGSTGAGPEGPAGPAGAAGNMGRLSFVIRNNAGTYEVYNGETGAMDYDDADFPDMFDAAVGDTPAGGTIGFCADTYVVDRTLAVPHAGVNLIGAGAKSTIFDSSAGATTPLLTIGDNTDLLYQPYVADIGFKGTIGTTDLLNLSNSRSGVIERCNFDHFKYGIHVDGTLGAFHQNYAHTIRNCYINGDNIGTSTAGIYLHGFDNSWKNTTTTIENCYIMYCKAGVRMDYVAQGLLMGGAYEHCDIGLDVYTYTNRSRFIGLDLEANTTWDIRIQGAGDDCDFNTFIGCDMWSTGKEYSDGGWLNQKVYCTV